MGTILVTREDPNVWSFTQLDHYKSDEYLSLNQAGFKMAFGLYDYRNETMLNDPSMFEWQVFLSTYKNNKWQGGI